MHPATFHFMTRVVMLWKYIMHYRLSVTLRHIKFLLGNSEYIPHDNYGTLKC